MITIIILSGVLFLYNANAQTCRSETGGYCAKLATIAQAQGLENIISGKDIGDLVPGIYKFGLGLVGISALAALIVGGIMYMTAGGSQDQTKRARTWVSNAFFGLALALLSYLILNTINPDLLKKLDLRLEPIRQEATPQTTTDGPTDAESLGARNRAPITAPNTPELRAREVEQGNLIRPGEPGFRSETQPGPNVNYR